MDIRCIRCGEPWEMDTLHEVAAEQLYEAGMTAYTDREYMDKYQVVKKDFLKRGCVALGGDPCEKTANPLIGAIYDILGDDLDGAAAEFEDAEWMGYLE